jgi:hypothetical protein
MTHCIRIRVLARQPGPEFHAEVGEERTIMRGFGQALIAKGEAELVADPWPAAASGSGSRRDPAERPSKNAPASGSGAPRAPAERASKKPPARRKR